MGTHRFRRGLSLPISGAPEQILDDAAAPGTVALVAADYPGMKPAMHVSPGDGVRRGQLLFEDRKQPGVRLTSPAAGTVAAVNRGAKRALISVVVRVDPSDQAASGGAQVDFASYTGRHPSALSREEVEALLVESGDWTALRARPFGRTAALESKPKSIFVTAMNSEPFAPDADLIAEGRAGDLERGLAALGRLTDGPVYLCRAPGTLAAVEASGQVRIEEFLGPHPAGAPGLHIHTLDPVNRSKLVWQIGLQDTLAIGRLFATGEPDVARIVALAGPPVRTPRLLRTRLGASLAELVRGEIEAAGETGSATAGRIVSGSPLSGRTAIDERAPADLHGYLGRFHDTVSVLEDDHSRRFLGWLQPGFGAFSRAPRLRLHAAAAPVLRHDHDDLGFTARDRADRPLRERLSMGLAADLPAQVPGRGRHRTRRGTRLPGVAGGGSGALHLRVPRQDRVRPLPARRARTDREGRLGPFGRQ